MEIFDEDRAVAFIRNKLKENDTVTTNYKSDDILEVIDIIWDYYEDNGMLDLETATDDATADNVGKDELIAHVTKMLSKDKNTRIQASDVAAIVNAELEYEALCEDF